MHIHILGICGTFMGSLALLAREAGHTVTGADQHVYPPMSDQLEAAGITLHQGYDAEHIAQLKPDSVVIGNALSRGNASVEYVLDQGLDYQSGPQWLAEHVLHDRWVLAVAGTHGKTTSASMLAWILEHAGLSPGYLIGGVPSNFGQSARLGSSPYFVIEADEYDTAFFDKRSKFVHYHPRTLVLNNLEFDHADIFDDLAAIQKQFHHLIRTVPASGRILVPAEPALQAVIDMGCWSGLEYLSGSDSPWQLQAQAKDQSIFYVERCDASSDSTHHGTASNKAGEGEDPVNEIKVSDSKVSENKGQVQWPLCGEHNTSNALAAIAAANHVGVSVKAATAALSEFTSVKRRMEQLASIDGVTVYDDFAHHPSAIKTTLVGLRARYPDSRVIAIIEPRSNTMRMECHHQLLPDAVATADWVYWFDPSAEPAANGEPSANGKPSAATEASALQTLFADSDKIHVLNSIEDIVTQVASLASKNDQIVIMSNGGFGGIHNLLIKSLSESASLSKAVKPA